MKTTKATTVTSWVSSNATHLGKLEKAKEAKVIRQGANSVPVDKVEVHIFVPKANYSSGMSSSWEAAIKQDYPDIDKVIVSTIEDAVGI